MNVEKLDHYSVRTVDLDRATRFYEGVKTTMKNNFTTAFHSNPRHFARPAGDRSTLAQLDAPGSSPSSVRRLANFRVLVAEFAVRQMGCAAVAEVLHCSSSAARNYLHELLDGGIVTRHPIDRTVYCQNSDPLVAHEFLAALARLGQGKRTALPTRRVHSLWNDAIVCCSSADQPARRDPLVAALFGAAGPPAQERS